MRIFSTVFERKTHVAYAIIEMKKAETAFKIVQKHEKNALYMKKCGKNGSREKNKRKRK